eukprot:3482017-Pyramimonas_sp.AAC.1
MIPRQRGRTISSTCNAVRNFSTPRTRATPAHPKIRRVEDCVQQVSGFDRSRLGWRGAQGNETGEMKTEKGQPQNFKMPP